MRMPGIELLAQQAGEFADIRDPVRITDWLFWGGLAAGALILVLIAWILFRRYRARRAERPAGPPPIPAGQWARQELERLAAEEGTYSDQDYTFAVSQIVREYLERAFALPAPERTTEEFLGEIGEHPRFNDAMRTGMSRFLERCDLIKFAGQQLVPEERPRLLGDARNFVETAERDHSASTPPAA